MITLTIVNKANRFFLLLAIILPTLSFAGDTQLGKQLYQQGLTIHQASALIVGEIQVEAERFPCQSCHLENGSGGFEGGVLVPPIDWRSLTVRRPSQQNTAYDVNKLRRTISSGLDSEGNELHSLMPRYRFSAVDFENLISYLQILDSSSDVGVNDEALRIGVMLTEEKAFAEIVSVVKKILLAYFQQINHEGGIHGRIIELVFTTPEKVRKDVFCYFAAIVSEVEQGALATNTDLLMLYPLSQFNFDAARVVSFQADFADQLSVLLAYLKKQDKAEQSLTIILDHDQQGQLLREKLKESMIQDSQVTIVETSPDQSITDLVNSSHDHIFWFSKRQYFISFLDALNKYQKTATIYSSIDLVGHLLAEQIAVPDHIQLVLTNPRGIPDTISVEYSDYQHFRSTSQIPDNYPEWQRSAYFVSLLLTETLKKSGRKINRQKLYQTATTIIDFYSGVMPPVNTSLTQTKPSQILQFDTRSRSLMSLQSWTDGQNF
jgi:ABC-type branched-subunit amino acid transport system substrate-binding protein